MSGRYSAFPVEPRQGTAQQKARQSDSGMTTNDSNKHDPELSAALRALAREDAKLSSSPDVEKSLLSKVRGISRARRHRTWFAVSSVAAALLLGIALYAWRIGNRQSSDTVQSP